MIIDKMDVNSEEIEALLRDIYTYLKRNKGNVTFSDEDRKIAEDLIDRSRKQLQKIAMLNSEDEDKHYDVVDAKPSVSQILAHGNAMQQKQRYVDMTPKQSTGKILDYPPPLPDKRTEPQPSETECPFKELPAKQVSHDIKYGALSIRRKVFNIIGRSSKVFGAVHQNWLLLYWSNKDAKPFCALDLKQYEAKEDESDPTKNELINTKDGGLKINGGKMASSFKVFQSISPDKKSYSFVATTHKDMLQWVVNINGNRKNPVIAGKITADPILQDNSDDEENIYIEIEHKPVVKPPRVQENESTEIPEESMPPSSPSFSGSEEAIYDELGAPKKSLNPSEFSEDAADDEDYDDIFTIRNEVKKIEDRQNNNFNNIPPPPLSPSAIYSNDTDAKENFHFDVSASSASDLQGQAEVLTQDKAKTEKETTKIKPEVPKRNQNGEIAKLDEKSVSTSKPNQVLPNKFWNRKSSRDLLIKKDSSNGNSKNAPSPEKGNITSKKLVSLAAISAVPKKECSLREEGSPKQNQGGNVMKIIRQRFTPSQHPNLETFSRNSKLETFQASPIKECVQADFDFSDSPAAQIDCLKPIDSLESRSSKKEDDDEKPMVLLKHNMDDEDSSKKFKKSPIIPVKPKKAAKKLQF